MSAYNDAVAYLDAEVHSRCDYEIYSDMRDIVDEMEAENAELREQIVRLLDKTLELEILGFKLRKLVREVVEFHMTEHTDMEMLRFYSDKNHGVYRYMLELGIEVE